MLGLWDEETPTAVPDKALAAPQAKTCVSARRGDVMGGIPIHALTRRSASSVASGPSHTCAQHCKLLQPMNKRKHPHTGV